MKIGILTSSRADYGIYLPLLTELKKDSFFSLEIIAFGTHLSNNHGFTIEDIIKDEYDTIHKITTLIDDDSEKGIVLSYSRTILEFSDFWTKNSYDLVFCLGDRFEMSAAVQSAIPFGIKFAHIHGGETTLGAIDNIYRHQITLASCIHFTTTKKSLKKVQQLIGDSKFIFNVGSLSLNDILSFKPIKKSILYNKFNIKNKPFALVTFHPETVSVKYNSAYANEMRKALNIISDSIFIVVTMPNADTMGSLFRKKLYQLRDNKPENVILVENFGKINYFSAMHYSSLLIGNTSSGIIEAASFKKYVINVGERQKGREQSLNVINVPFDSNKIVRETLNVINKKEYLGRNNYFKKEPSKSIIKILKNE